MYYQFYRLSDLPTRTHTGMAPKQYLASHLRPNVFFGYRLSFFVIVSESYAKTLGGSNWEVRLKMAREFVNAINRHGGNATLVELPKIGIKGNSHFLMQELNNDVIAAHVANWLNRIVNFKIIKKTGNM